MSSTRLIIGCRFAWWGLGASGARRPGHPENRGRALAPRPHPLQPQPAPLMNWDLIRRTAAQLSPTAGSRRAARGVGSWSQAPSAPSPLSRRPCCRPGSGCRPPSCVLAVWESPLRAAALHWDPGGRAPESPVPSPRLPELPPTARLGPGVKWGPRPAGSSSAQPLPLPCPGPGARGQSHPRPQAPGPRPGPVRHLPRLPVRPASGRAGLWRGETPENSGRWHLWE